MKFNLEVIAERLTALGEATIGLTCWLYFGMYAVMFMLAIIGMAKGVLQ